MNMIGNRKNAARATINAEPTEPDNSRSCDGGSVEVAISPGSLVRSRCTRATIRTSTKKTTEMADP